MKLVVDVGYKETGTLAAGVLFENWTDSKPSKELVKQIKEVEDYVPGQFYKRELPCIMELIQGFESQLDTIVVDGFVWLSNETDEPKPGLGAHLYEALNQKTPVIGVAKTDFHRSGAAQLLRGKSKRPLFISCVGIELLDAIHCINKMHGTHRIPTLLKRVDQLSRN